MFEKNYQKIRNRFKRHVPFMLYNNAFRHRQILKFLIAGGASTFVDIFIYTALVYLVGLWYIASSIFSFAIAFCVSFSLQKFWTFREKSTERMMKQTYLYFFTAIVNLGISTMLIYLFVDYVHVHKFLSKIFANIIVATESFFIFRYFIFAKRDQIEIGEMEQRSNLQ